MPRKSLSIVSKRLPKEKSWETLSLPLTKSKVLVVSTIISGILFARFSTVDCVPIVYSFLVTSLSVEARNERENGLFAPLLMHFVSNKLCSRLQHTLAPPIESQLSFSTGTFLNNYDVIERKL